jgi:hypothetical protein
VLFVLIGGVLEVGRASGPYRTDVNRSYVAQGAILVGQSTQTGAMLRSLMASMTTRTRTSLQQELDTLAAASSHTAAAAAALSPPAPTVGGFPAALAARAKGVAEVRAAVDGLLGLSRAGQALLTPDRAAALITGAGTLLERSDRTYAAVRRQFRAAPGRATLPRSTWVTDPQGWGSGPVRDLVRALASTATLAPVQRIVLRPDAVRITPAASPPVRPGGSPVVVPTKTLQVSAVVADEGNVGASGVEVSAKVTPQGAGATDSSTAKVSLEPGGSVAVTLPELAVTPGDTYSLTVSVAVPAAQTDRSQTSVTFVVRVAPPTPTTTVPGPASTSHRAAS